MGLERLLATLTEVVVPSLCASCPAELAGGEVGLCRDCWARVVPASGGACPRCGSSCGDGEPCLACQAAPPPMLGTAVWGEHAGVLRDAILALKHGGRDELAEPLSARLAARVAVAPWARELDLVTAVPSHPLHRLRRGATAAELLAAGVAARLRLPAVELLDRRGCRRQVGRSRDERLALPPSAFRARADLAGSRVLVVDDVTTTGTTLRRAAEALLAAHTGAVYCAALAGAFDDGSGA